MSRNELNSFYQNAKREVQRAIAKAKLCDDKLDEYFSEVSHRLSRDNNPRSHDFKDNFKKAVKQFNFISELFLGINLELREVPESELTAIEELENQPRSEIPALLPSAENQPLQIGYSPKKNEVSYESNDCDINSFEKNSKFLSNEVAGSLVIINTPTPPPTPRHVTPSPSLRRPKEALKTPPQVVTPTPPVVEEKLIPYRQVDVSKFKTDYKFRGYVSHIQVSAFGLVFVCEVSTENFKAINGLANDFKNDPGQFPEMAELPQENNVFGIVLEGIFIRAVRQITPTCDQIYLVDSGEILPFSIEHNFYQLPERFQRFPGLAFFAQIVTCKGSQDFDINAILEKYECCSFDFTVISAEDEILLLDVGGFKVLPGIANYSEPTPPPEMVVTPAQREILMEEPLNTSNAMKAVTGYDPKDDKNLCKFTNPVTGESFCFVSCSCLGF